MIEVPVYPTLPSELEASEPPEARGLSRDGVRLLVGRRATGEVSHHAFRELPRMLRAGDVVVVNTSATIPAAVPVLGGDLTVHFSAAWSDQSVVSPRWLVELRRVHNGATVPFADAVMGQECELPGGASIQLLSPYSEGRLWIASVHAGLGVVEYLQRYGTPIRYGYVHRSWPLQYYQTVFGREPGSAEMPSAGRPFTHAMVTELVTSGVVVVPVLLHTGVASPEAHERPYPERFAVSAATARTINQRRASGGRTDRHRNDCGSGAGERGRSGWPCACVRGPDGAGGHPGVWRTGGGRPADRTARTGRVASGHARGDRRSAAA